MSDMELYALIMGIAGIVGYVLMYLMSVFAFWDGLEDDPYRSRLLMIPGWLGFCAALTFFGLFLVELFRG